MPVSYQMRKHLIFLGLGLGFFRGRFVRVLVVLFRLRIDCEELGQEVWVEFDFSLADHDSGHEFSTIFRRSS